MIDLLIVNYNLPEAVTEIMDSINSRIRHRWIIVDNGSDVIAPHPLTNVSVTRNDGWMSGMRAGLAAVSSEFVWVFTTSFGAVTSEHDPIAELKFTFDAFADVVSVTPAWTGYLTPETHKRFAKGKGDYENIGWANPACFWRTDFLKENIEYRSRSGWGTDYELSYLASEAGLQCYRCNNVTMEVHEHRGYDNGRRHVDLQQSERDATAEMHAVYSAKYGADWMHLLGVR